ncbi:hypothetical protein ISCGN_029246 [Ixodes scapularis]
MVHFRPYEPLREGLCRGVFHGADPSDSPEDLLAELSCSTHKILAARHMDGEGRTVMITVDGSTLPKEVLYRLHHKKVFPFQHGSELKRRLAASAHPPDIILLQEAKVPEPKIVGYRAFSTPTIIVAQKGPRRKRDAQGTIPVPQAHAHVLLKKSIPAAQLDTSCYSSEQREVTAVSARLGDKDIVVVSVYWRPHSTTNDEDAEWLKLLCTRTIHPLPVLIGGDFNAHHTSWGSKSNTVRGRSVADNALVAGLLLANSPNTVTRRADSQQQDSTSPDVTWHSPSLRCSWAAVDDTWGSDHFPIIIGLGGKSRALATRTVSTTRWDDFREVLAELPPHEPLFNRIIQAKEIVTRSVKVSAEAPTPDQHLLNLWESRIKAQHCYLEGGKLPPDRTRFNLASAEAKRYSLELSRKEWHDHCTSFNGRTSPAKVWATMRGMTKNQRQQTAGEDMALRLAISNEEFASKAGPVFFPQECPASYDPAKVRFYFPPPQEPMDPSMERPFTMAELQGALFSITKLHGAPGPDMITVPALRNLPEAAMQELLDIFNESWELGQLPAIWRHASVIPIPKPGRTPKQLTDMRPISLTSHVGKLMERMALMRLEWHIEANNDLHLCQTGFRRGLITQDSLALFAEDLAGKHPRYDIKIAVAIDVKKAFDSVPHPTVMAAASAAGLTGKPLQYIREFLNGRTYSVSVGNAQAPAAPLELGVPQGAVLSPLLYNLPKDPTPPEAERVVIYQVQCKECDASYIGETERKRKTRLKEHARDVANSTNATRFKSELVDHAWTSGHQFDFDKARDKRWGPRKLLESWFIQNDKRGSDSSLVNKNRGPLPDVYTNFMPK